jgi:hypothetical protein
VREGFAFDPGAEQANFAHPTVVGFMDSIL